VLTGIGQGFDFSMGKTHLLRKTGTDNVTCLNDDATNPRIGIGKVEGFLRYGYSQAHKFDIVFGEHTSIKTDLSAGPAILVWIT
jgi:hypothetical protein